MKFSVIIPVYKAENTLNRCVDSLLKQNRTDTEIILVNDGSPDSSGEICRKYADSCPNVKYIEKENGGVSTARNVGLRAASGDYVLFVDSDDRVTDDYFDTIAEVLESYPYDFLQFSQTTVCGETVKQKAIPDFDSRNKGEIIRKIAEDMWRKYINTPTAKVFKREIIERNKISFLESLEVGEDRTFNIEYLLNVESFRALKKPLYTLFLENSDSLSRKKRDDLDEQLAAAETYLKNLFETKNFSAEEKELLIRSVDFDTMRAVYTKAKYLHRNGVPLPKRLKKLGEYCTAVNKKNYVYPDNKFCTLIALPVRCKLTPAIDILAWVLTR